MNNVLKILRKQELIVLLIILLTAVSCAKRPVTWEERNELKKAVLAKDYVRVKNMVDSNPELLKIKGTADNSLLYEAFMYGDKRTQRFFLSKGLDPNSDNLLQTLAVTGAFEEVKFLVEEGKIDFSIPSNSFALIQSSVNRHNKITRYLVEKGADINVKSSGRNPLLIHASHGDLEMVKFLLAHGADTSVVDDYGDDLFDHAVMGGNMEVLRFIESKGYKASDPEKAFFDSIRSGNVQMVKLLYKDGFQLKNSNGIPVLLLIDFNNGDSKNVEVIKFLVSHGADVDSETKGGKALLNKAIDAFRPEIVKCLIDLGADVEHKTWDKMTPLFQAIRHTKNPVEIQLVKLLIEGGAKTDITDGFGNTLLDASLLFGEADTIDFFISKGLSSGKHSAFSPLHLCACSKNKKALEYFVGKGFNVNEVDSELNTPLHYAVTGDFCNSLNSSIRFAGSSFGSSQMDFDLVKYLVKKGAKIDAKNSKGLQPLHVVFIKDYDTEKAENTADFLVSRGADVNARDNEGNTPLLYCQYSSEIKKLISLGADINARNNKGEGILYLILKKKFDDKSRKADEIDYLLSKGALPGLLEINTIIDSKDWELLYLIAFKNRLILSILSLGLLLISIFLFILFRHRRKINPSEEMELSGNSETGG